MNFGAFIIFFRAAGQAAIQCRTRLGPEPSLNTKKDTEDKISFYTPNAFDDTRCFFHLAYSELLTCHAFVNFLVMRREVLLFSPNTSLHVDDIWTASKVEFRSLG